MNSQMVKLTTQRTNLSIALIVLHDDYEDAPEERKASVLAEIVDNRCKLQGIERDIEVMVLNEMYDKSNVCDKPVTIILKEI